MNTKKIIIIFLLIYSIIFNISVNNSYAKSDEVDFIYESNNVYPSMELKGVSHVYYNSRIDAEAAPLTIYSESKKTICYKHRIIYASPGYVVEYGCLII